MLNPKPTTIAAGRVFPSTGALLLLLALCVFLPLASPAQSTVSNEFAVYRTGQGAPLTTDARAFDVPADLLAPFFQFEFGFGTDEFVTTNVIFDSWSATVQTSNGLSTGVYFTADANGVQWAPPTPGNVVISPDAILRQAIAFPSLEPVHSMQWAYQVSAPIPADFFGQTVFFYFDLFDNGPGPNSLGWVSKITIVPEPAPLAIALLGMVWAFSRNWREKKR